jgi:protein-disulfide isomerase
MAVQKGTLARWGASLLPTLTGLVASAILLVDYVRPAPVFCDEGGGCDAVKQTAFAHVLGIPTPVFGIAAFLSFGLLALLAGAGAALALLLLAIQAKIGHFCVYCSMADVSMLVVAGAATWRLRSAWDLPEARAPRWLSGAVVTAALAAPLIVGFTKKSPLPPTIEAELAKTPRDQITIIDFVDFECPFCRMTHAALTPVLEAKKDRIRFVRKQVPLTRIHPHALDAARAACCGEALGKGDAMANALFEAPAEELTADGCAKLALSLGIDGDAFRACVGDPKTDARIQADSADFKASNGKGLPTIWIEGQKLEGMQPEEVLDEAVRTALDRKG